MALDKLNEPTNLTVASQVVAVGEIERLMIQLETVTTLLQDDINALVFKLQPILRSEPATDGVDPETIPETDLGKIISARINQVLYLKSIINSLYNRVEL